MAASVLGSAAFGGFSSLLGLAVPSLEANAQAGLYRDNLQSLGNFAKKQGVTPMALMGHGTPEVNSLGGANIRVSAGQANLMPAKNTLTSNYLNFGRFG